MHRFLIVLVLLLWAGQARATDPVLVEILQQNSKILARMEQRLGYLEQRVAQLESRVTTPYAPGAPPPPVHTPPPPAVPAGGSSSSGYYSSWRAAYDPCRNTPTVPPSPLPAYYK